MAEALVEELTLDISPALDALGPLGTALDDVAVAFGVSLADAITQAVGEPIPIEPDTTPLTAGIDEAIAGASGQDVAVDGDVTALDDAITTVVTEDQPPIVVDGDASLLGVAIEDVTDIQREVPVDADTAGLGADIDAAVTEPREVPVDADTTGAQAALDDLSAQTVEVPVEADTAPVVAEILSLQDETITLTAEADTTAAQTDLTALGDSATKATGSQGSGEGVAGLGGALLGIKAASGAAAGGGAEVAGAFGEVAVGATAAVAGGVVFAGFLKEVVGLAADAQAQQARFNDTFGQTADIVEHIDVGGLVISLKELGAQSGTTEADLQASATRIGLLGKAAGAAAPEVAKSAGSILGLAGAVSVANPRLGDTAVVADSLTKAFVTGRTRGLVPYGIAISGAAVASKALQIAQENGRDTANSFDKIQAGLTLTLEQQGDTLGGKFANGAQNASIQLRALKVAVEENLVALGKPLLAPVLDVLTAILPVGLEVGKVLGELARIVLPLLAAAAPLLLPLVGSLDLVAAGLGVIADAVEAVPPPVSLALVAAGIIAVAIASGTAIPALIAFGTALTVATGPIGITVAAIAALGLAFGTFGDDQIGRTGEQVKQFAESMFGAGQSAATLAPQVADLQGTVKAFQEELLNDQTDSFASDLRLLGLTVDDTSAKVAGSIGDFNDFLDVLRLQGDVGNDLADKLLAQGDALDIFASNQLDAAVATGKLTQEQVDQALAANSIDLTDGTTAVKNYTGVWQQLAPAIAAAEEAQRQSVLSSSVQSGAISDLVVSFQLGAVDAATFSTQLHELGVSEADAKTLTDDLTTAQTEQADASILAGSAAQQLEAQFAAGKISATELEAALVGLGVSVAGAGTASKGLATDINSFAQSVLSSLPSAEGAIKDFSKNAGAAEAQLAKDTHDHTGNIKDDLRLLAETKDPQRFVEELLKQTQAILSFDATLAALAQFPLLREQFAKAGPEEAAVLAEGFVGAPAKAKLAEALLEQQQQAAIDAANAEAAAHGKFVATGGVAAAGLVGGYVGGIDGKLVAPTQTEIGGVQTSIVTLTPEVAAAAGGLGAEATTHYSRGLALRDTTTLDVRPIPGVITGAQGPSGVAAGGLGTHVTGKYEGGLDVPGATQGSIKESQAVWSGAEVTGPTANAAIHGGRVVGLAFDAGIAQGIESEAGLNKIRTAGARAAQAAITSTGDRLRARSPSKEGEILGGFFTDGLALGITTGAQDVVAAAESIVSDLTGTFAGAFGPTAPTPTLTIPGPAISPVLAPVGASVAGGGSGELHLDLTIHVGDDEPFTATVTVPVRGSSVIQRAVAEVHAL